MHIRRVSGFLALLLSTTLLTFSCITADKSVGQDYIPDEHKLQIKRATIKLPVTLKTADSLQGVSSSYMTIGAFNTEEFGYAEFGSAANICPTSSTLNLGKDRKIISTYMLMNLAKKSEENTTLSATSVVLDKSQKNIAQTFNFYRLKKFLDSTSVYIGSINEADYDPTPLNTHEVTYFGGDSIKVYLDNKFGEEILAATDKELDSLDLFMKNHKGIYIKPDKLLAGVNGGRLNLFSRVAAAIYIKFNFQPTWNDTLARKDTLITLMLGDAYCVNTAKHETKGKVYPDDLKELPIEGIGGVTPYINSKELKDLIDNWKKENGYEGKKILVTKARLVFPYPEPENYDDFTYKYPKYLFPNQRLKLSDTTTLKYYYLTTDQSSTDNPMGKINRSLSIYSCDYSESTQRLINDDKEEIKSHNDIWLRPIFSETNTTYGTVSYYPDQYVYYSGRIYGPAADNHPVLEIVYAVLDSETK